MIAPAPAGCGGVIIAGGRATRMGGVEKPLLRLRGRAILDHIVERVRPQVDVLAIDVRSESRGAYADWSRHGVLLSDPFGGAVGPIGGIIGALEWLASLDGAFRWLATFPGDAPFVPRDLVAHLRDRAGANGSRPVVARDAHDVQGLFALWPLGCRAELTRCVRQQGLRSVREALHAFDAIGCDVCDARAFTNINAESDLRAAASLVDDAVMAG